MQKENTPEARAVARGQEPVKMTESEWIAEGERRFGPDRMKWRFICPSCGYVASVQEWKDAGAQGGAVAFSCVGRYTGSRKELGDKTGGPCNYAGGGLFRLNPIEITHSGGTTHLFAFAESKGEQP